jgi:hypothetical protein
MTRKLLDAVTSVVLAVVVLALGWIISASYAPEAVRWASEDMQVIVILILLTAALVLVSAVALGHTRSRDLP